MRFFKLVLIGLALGLSACTAGPKDITTITTPRLDPPLPTQIQVDPVTWHVYTATDLKTLSKNKNVVLFSLSQADYEKLGKNLVEIQRYILQLKQTVIFYKTQNAANN